MTMTQQEKTDFKDALAQKAKLANQVLLDILDSAEDIQPDIHAAMRYTLDAPGKRIRAAMVFWCCELIAGEVTPAAKAAAAAIEMVHTYSLVHDDLPEMDNDDMRRGRPTCHKQFDEATALLTGDALLTYAFEVIADKVDDSKTALSLIRLLAKAAGPAGMIAGQMQDLNSEKQQGTLDILRYIHTNKTAKMFAASAAMGAVAGGADHASVKHLYSYGLDVGLCFQVADDLLDISASSQQLGKTAGKDQAQGKVTYPAVIGRTNSLDVARQLTQSAVEELTSFGPRADILRQLAVELLSRSK